MEIVRERMEHEVGAELELQQHVNTVALQSQGTVTWIVPKHYNLQEDSSDEDDAVPGQILRGGHGDCTCCVCGKNFTVLNNLIEHFSMHKDEVRCHLCQVTFTRIMSLALHLENAHPNYHLYCKSCKVMFQNTWHMNQHMEKHFVNMQAVDAIKASKPSVKQEPLEDDVEQIIIENEEVEIKYLKEEEEEVDMLGNMQETMKRSTTRTTEQDYIFKAVLKDHNYCSSTSLKNPRASGEAPAYNTRSSVRECTDNTKNVSSETLHVFNNKQNTKDSQSVSDQQKKLEEVVMLFSLPQKEGASSACRAILQAAYEKVTRCQITEDTTVQGNTNESSFPSSTSAVLEPVQLQSNIKVEDDSEDNLWECAPIEEDMVKEEDEKDGSTLQAAYEKVKIGPSTGTTTVQGNTNDSSLSSSASAVLEPVQGQCTIKLEDDSEVNLWECAPIEEDMVKEEDEEDISIKEESDSSFLDNLIYTNEEVTDSVTDTDITSDSSDASRDDKQKTIHKPKHLSDKRILQTQTCASTKENPSSVKVNAGPQTCSSNEKPLGSGKGIVGAEPRSSNEKLLSTVNVNAGPALSSSNESPFHHIRVNVDPKPSSAKDLQICSVCGLSKIPNIPTKLKDYCKCTSLMCHMCGLVCGNDKLLLKHQAEIHPLTKYICSCCHQIYPNQTSFTMHHCCAKATVPHGQFLTPANTAGNVERPPKLILQFVPSPAAGVSSMQPLNNGASENVSSLKIFYPNNVLVDKSQKVSTMYNSTSVLSNNPSITQTVPVQVCAPVTLNGGQKVPSEVLKGVQNPVPTAATATRANKRQAKVLIPPIAPTNVKPTTMVFHSVLPQQNQVLGASPVCIPGYQVVSSDVLKGVQNPVPTAATATQAKKGQAQVLIPASSPVSVKTTKIVFQSVLSQKSQILGTNPVHIPSNQGVPSKVLNEGQDPVPTVATATRAKKGQAQILLPASSPASVKPSKIVMQSILPQNSQILGTNPVRIPGNQEVPSEVLKEGQYLVPNAASATQAKKGQAQVLIPASSSASRKTTKIVIQSVLPQQSQIIAANPVSVPGNRGVPSEVLKKGQYLVTTAATATQAKQGQAQVSIPASSPVSVKPSQMTFQSVLPQQSPGLGADPVHVPVSTSLPLSRSSTLATGSNQSKITLRIPTYPSTTTNVSVSISPTPIQFPPPTLVSSKLKPISHKFQGNVGSDAVPLPELVPSPVCSTTSTQAHIAAPVQTTFNLLDSLSSSSSAQDSTSQSSLQIVALFVNQSQELALQNRLQQNWRSKTIFPCRHCGAIARQPALGVRHRYQHRGPRLHKCQCGRTFQQRLHLLRHQVQHAEAMRYVCAACGETFQGTHQLAYHKQRVHFKVLPSNLQITRRDCRNVFHCDCGQAFVRSSALLWHMLKNSQSYKQVKKASGFSYLAT